MGVPMKSPAATLAVLLCASAALLTPFVAFASGQAPLDPDAEVRGIVARPEISRALAIVRELETEAERELVELTQIPAPPFGEAARAARYAELLGGAGLDDVVVDGVGNVLARRPGSGDGETVAIVAHLDTVFPVGTDVTVRHEGDLRGVRHLLRADGPRVDQFIAIDGGTDSRVINQALGSRRYRITLTGPGGHSWGDFGLANPAHALGRVLFYFDEAAAEVVNVGPPTSYNVGRIGGGTSVNAVPHESWAEVDLRSVDPDQLERVEDVLRRSVERGLDEQNRRRDRGEPLSADLEQIGDRPSGTVDPNTPLVRRAMAVTRLLGLSPHLGAASTDANLPIADGIPAVTIGRGGVGGGAHSLGEWWAAHDAHVGTERALLLLVASAGLVD